MMATNWRAAIQRPISIAPLVTFRITFGLLMFFSLLRFGWRGWIEDIYIQPRFHFSYWGFEWVQSLGNPGMYVLYSLVILSSLFITIGFLYRLSVMAFFMGFTYIELIDITTYLNHYYFISLVSFIMIWLPANRHYSIDAYLNPSIKKSYTPIWTVGLLRFQMAIVYIFAGIAKLNYDWLILAEPMRTWLPGKSHLPIVGDYMYETWVAYLFSWFGCGYDLFIVAFLLNKKTRLYGYAFVLIFHTATAIFFPGIGMFPFVMMLSSWVFFSSSFHQKLLSKLTGISWLDLSKEATYKYFRTKWLFALWAIYIGLQILLPFRYALYPGHLFWNEEGFRFSWRVMLMEKAGLAFFKVKDNGKTFEINNAQYLTPLQEKMMSTQPDMILKYAHFLEEEYRKKGFLSPEVYAEVYVTLNSVPSQLFIDSTVNLAAQPLSWTHYNWVLPFNRKKSIESVQTKN